MILIAALALILADTPIGITPEAVVWKDGPPTLPAGAKIAVLEGDPRAAGMFTMRVRVPAGAALAPHWHPRHERVTILSGAAELGFGSTADRAAVKRYGPGSFYVNPPRTMHYLFFPEETVMQMTGIGPWELFTTDVERASASSGTVTVRSTKPAAGSPLTSKVEATVDYTIQNFHPDTFYLSIQFESTVPNQTFSATETVVSRSNVPSGPPRPKFLSTPTGTATASADFTNASRNPNLRKPVRVKVYLHEITGDMTSRVVATSDWIEFR